MTQKSVAAYNTELAYELRLKDVPGKVIGDTLAQVESHVADSNESPEDAFGSPEDFARQLARGRKKLRAWSIFAVSIVLTFSGSLLILRAAFGLIQGKTVLWGLSPVAGFVLGGLAILAEVLFLVFLSDPIRDPRKRK